MIWRASRSIAPTHVKLIQLQIYNRRTFFSFSVWFIQMELIFGILDLQLLKIVCFAAGNTKSKKFQNQLPPFIDKRRYSFNRAILLSRRRVKHFSHWLSSSNSSLNYICRVILKQIRLLNFLLRFEFQFFAICSWKLSCSR